MAASDKVLELIKRFNYNLSSYRSDKCNETDEVADSIYDLNQRIT